MSEYIKTDDIVKSINVLLDNVDASEDAMHKFCDSMNDIQKVEVVRCKDCKHYVIHTLFGHSQGWCERLCDKFDKSLAHGTEGDDFCSYGERADT